MLSNCFYVSGSPLNCRVRSDLGRPPPCPTLIKFFESPAIAQDDFTVYEAKPTDHGNPLYDADLTPLRRPGAKTVKTVEIRGLHGQIPGEEADAIDDVFFNDENKDPAETA